MFVHIVLWLRDCVHIMLGWYNCVVKSTGNPKSTHCVGKISPCGKLQKKGVPQKVKRHASTLLINCKHRHRPYRRSVGWEDEHEHDEHTDAPKWYKLRWPFTGVYCQPSHQQSKNDQYEHPAESKMSISLFNLRRSQMEITLHCIWAIHIGYCMWIAQYQKYVTISPVHI